VQVEYDPSRIAYATLLEIFWRNIDPTQRNGQFREEGSEHRSVIFYHDEQQKLLALASKARLEKSKPFDGEVVTEIVAASDFYRAEEKYQDYYWRNPGRYRAHLKECGRTEGLQALWGAPA
jgi:peptide-methionine (S)-S-oxide reductase